MSLLLHYQQFFRIDHAFQNSFPSFSYNPFLHRNLFEMIENQKCSIPLSFKTIIETHRFKFTSVPRCRGIKSVRDILEKILRLNDPPLTDYRFSSPLSSSEMAWWVASRARLSIISTLGHRSATFEFRAATLHAVSPANIIHLTFSQGLDFALELFLRSPTSFSLKRESGSEIQVCIYFHHHRWCKTIFDSTIRGWGYESFDKVSTRLFGKLATRFSSFRNWIFVSCLVFIRCANKFFLFFFFQNPRFYKSIVSVGLNNLVSKISKFKFLATLFQ